MVTVKVNWVIVRLTWLLTRSFCSYIYDTTNESGGAQIKGFWHEPKLTWVHDSNMTQHHAHPKWYCVMVLQQ